MNTTNYQERETTMLSFQGLVPKAALSLALLSLIPAGVNAAQNRSHQPARADFLEDAPSIRVQKWQDTLSTYVQRHSELSSEQMQAINDLADIRDESFFGVTLNDEQRSLLAKRFEVLGKVLPYAEYTDLMRDFGTLRGWLLKNEVIIGEGGGGTCNCDADSDCATGYHCAHSGCTVQQGSLSNGVCAL